MSYPITYYDFWQQMWDKYSDQYFKFCRTHNMQADLSEFSLWCEENDLIGDDGVYDE